MSDSRTRLWSVPGLAAALAILPFAVGGWALLMPLIPLALARAGHSAAVASAATGIFMAAVVGTQLVTPLALRALGYRPVILVGALLMGVPTMGMVLTTAAGWWYIVAALRGAGFGLLTVACTSLPAVIAPQAMLGRTAGAQGVAMSITLTAGLPTGLLLDDHFGFDSAAIVATVLSVMSCGMLLFIPSLKEQKRIRPSRCRGTSRQCRRAVVTVTLLTAAAVWGGLSALIPIAQARGGHSAVISLTAFSAASVAGRQLAGMSADRGRSGLLTLPAVLIAAVSTAGVAAPLANASHTGWAYAAMQYGCAALFGFGFGVIQNDTLLAMFALFDDAGRATASKWWNIAVDLGIGVGSFGLGALASTCGLGTACITGAVILVLVAPAASAMRRSVTMRPTAVQV